MKRKTVALFLASVMAVSGIMSVPAMADDMQDVQAVDEDIVIEPEEDPKEAGLTPAIGKSWTTTTNSDDFNISGLSDFINTSSGFSGGSVSSSTSHSESVGYNTGSSSSTTSGSTSGWSSSHSSGSNSSTGTPIGNSSDGSVSGSLGDTSTVYVLGNIPASVTGQGHSQGHSSSSGSSSGSSEYDSHVSVSGTSNGVGFSSTSSTVERTTSGNNSHTGLMTVSTDTNFKNGVTATAAGSFSESFNGTAFSLSGQANVQYSNGLTATIAVHATQANNASNIDLTMSYSWSDGTGESIGRQITPTFGIGTAVYYATAYIQYHEKKSQQSQGGQSQGTNSGSSQGSTSGTSTSHASGSSSSQGTGGSSSGTSYSYGQNTGHSTGTSVSVGNGTSLSLGRTSNGVAVSNIGSNGSSVSVPAFISWSSGSSQPVGEIASGAVKGKTYNTISLNVNRNTKFGKNILKDKKAKKTKTVRITCTNGKLKASSFNKKAFSGYKGKLVISKKSISKKEFSKLKKKLKKGGMKGKIVRK